MIINILPTPILKKSNWRHAGALTKWVLSARTLLIGLISIFCLSGMAQTITGEQKIIYTITDAGAKLAEVSADNSSMHRTDNSALVIPASVTYEGVPYTVTGMAAGAFANTTISSIDIQAPIAAIPENAFNGCSNMSSITIGGTVTSIGDNAFFGCSKLVAPQFPETVTSIGASAFENCTSLGALVLPPNAALGDRAFAGSDISSITFQTEKVKLGTNLFDGVTSLTKVIIPAWMKSVPAYAFANEPDLAEIDFTAVTSGNLAIHEYAVSNCPLLAKVSFPDKINRINDNAFRSATSLTSVKLPEMNYLGVGAFRLSGITKIAKSDWPAVNITTIGALVFAETPLSSIEFPDWMTKVPNAICRNCVELASISFPENLTSIGNFAFANHPMKEDDPTLVNNVLTEVHIPETVTGIGGYAFENNRGLTQLTLHEGLEILDVACFLDCRIKSVVIPSTIKELGHAAFCGNSMESVTMPSTLSDGRTSIKFGTMVFAGNSMETFYFPDWLTVIPNSLLMNCGKLGSVRFAPNTTDIKAAAFQNAFKLSMEGSLPETVTHIGEEAFSMGGWGLPDGQFFINKLEIGPDVQIDDKAFAYARIGAVEFTSCDYNIGNKILLGVTSIKSVSFPDCMTEIPNGICMGWTSLTTVKWPANLKSIGAQAFRNCINLDLDNGTEEGNVLDMTKFPFNQVQEWGDFAFSGSVNMEAETKRPDGNTITKVIWPENGKNAAGEDLIIGRGLFEGNGRMTEGTIPAWMDKIPARLYANCTKMENIKWEQSDRTGIELGDSCFMATGIHNISWPDVPAKIGNYAFRDCKNAGDIMWPESKAEFGKGVFKASGIGGTVGVKPYITVLPDETFEDCVNVKEFNLPTVSAIGKRAFRNCTTAEKYKFKSLQEVPDSAFMNNRKMTVLNTPNSVFSHVGVSGFEGCSSMTQYYGKIDGKTKLDARAFCGNSNVTAFYGIPTDLSAEGILAGCTTLNSLIFSANPNNNILAISVDCFDKDPLLSASDFQIKMGAEDIAAYEGPDRGTDKGWLNVSRDMKYKLVEKGYGKLFNINELHEPKEGLNILGDIHSSFKPGDTYNKYSTMLRWEIVQSDLNIAGPTVYHLYRDNEEIAKIEIGVPTEVPSINDGNINTDEPAIACDVKVTKADGTVVDLKETYGTIDYEVAENTYREVYANQHSKLYFNKESSHRLGLNEALGARSWFVYVDEFDSPDLSSPGVPDRYVYTLRLDGGISYTVAEGSGSSSLATGVDNNSYESPNPVTVHATMVVPSIDFDGYYTLEQIEADTDHSLPLSTPFNADGTLKVHYALSNPAHVNHKIQKENGTTVPVVREITSYQIASRTNPNDKAEWETISINGDPGKAEGDMIVQSGAGASEGSSFQIVTKTEGRGVFGSRIVSVPGLAHLNLTADDTSFRPADHPEHVGMENPAIFATDITLEPYDLDKIFYTGDERPSESQHRIGVWRSMTITPSNSAAGVKALADEEEMELVHHSGTSPVVDTWACNSCGAEQRYDGNWTYVDHAAVPNEWAEDPVDISANYLVRLYMQPADDDSKWMVVEAKTSRSGKVDIGTGINNVNMDGPEVRYYNLQGQRLMKPAKGQVVIRVDNNGSARVRM